MHHTPTTQYILCCIIDFTGFNNRNLISLRSEVNNAQTCVTLSLVPLSCGQVHVDGPRVYAAPFPVRGVVGQLTIIKENVVAERSGWAPLYWKEDW